ncbi:MAG: mechanosensitive ion channel domain-containing protein [Bacteroidales bacterium]
MNIRYLIFAIALFVVLRFTMSMVKSLPRNKSVKRILTRTFPLVEFAIWLGFGFWVLSRVFSDYTYYHLLISVAVGCLVLIVGWYFLRDFIAGIILKAEISFENNQHIRTPQADGILRKLGYRSIEIESSNGELVKIPFSQLATNSIHLQNVDETMQGHETTFSVSSKIPIQNVKDNVSYEVMLLPWASITHQPSIKVIDQGEEMNTYKVHFHALSDRHAEFIRQHVGLIYSENKD